MNKSQIGTNAGIVWNVLKDNCHWEYTKLKEATGLNDRDLSMPSDGWHVKTNRFRNQGRRR